MANCRCLLDLLDFQNTELRRHGRKRFAPYRLKLTSKFRDVFGRFCRLVSIGWSCYDSIGFLEELGEFAGITLDNLKLNLWL